MCTYPYRPAFSTHDIDPFANDFVLSFCLSSNHKDSNVAIASVHPVEHKTSKGTLRSRGSRGQDAMLTHLNAIEVSLPSPQSPARLSSAEAEHCDPVTMLRTGVASTDDTGMPYAHTSAPKGVCTIAAEDARRIFLAKTKRPMGTKDGLAARLADCYGISAKAVRDIWRMRTWSQATRPYWTPEDHKRYLNTRRTSHRYRNI